MNFKKNAIGFVSAASIALLASVAGAQDKPGAPFLISTVSGDVQLQSGEVVTGNGGGPTEGLVTLGTESWDAVDDEDNVVVELDIGAGNEVTGSSFDVSIMTSGNGSWCSEASVLLSNSDGSDDPDGIILAPATGVDASCDAGQEFSSGGVIDFAANGLPNIVPNADGILRLEFHESFDDVADDIDAFWGTNSSPAVVQGLGFVCNDQSACDAAVTPASVNVGHLAPFAAAIADTEVSVDVNGSEVLNPVAFNQFSGYLDVPAGDTDVDIIVPPGSGTAAISGTFTLPADSDSTVVAIGDDAGGGGNQPLELLALSDDLSAPSAGNAKVRVAHTAPFAANIADTAVSVRLDDGTVVNGLSSVEYKVDSGFFELPAGDYDLQIATPDGSTTLIDPEPVTLNDGDIVTLFAVGDITNQDLGVTAVFGDGSFLPLPLEEGDAGGPQSVPAMSTLGLMAMIALMLVIAIRRLM